MKDVIDRLVKIYDEMDSCNPYDSHYQTMLLNLIFDIQNKRVGVSSAVQPLVMPHRPGSIKELSGWRAKCWLCTWNINMPTYQEASIQLTQHLNVKHTGWEREA